MTPVFRESSRAIPPLALWCVLIVGWVFSGGFAGVFSGGDAWAQAVRPQRLDPQRVNQLRSEPPPADNLAKPQAEESPIEELAGFYAAQQRLGRDTPIGRGVVLGQVEGGAEGYIPAIHRASFEHVQFVTRSGPSDPFGHADAVARKMVGLGGLAPGVREVHNFMPQHWMTAGLLNAGTGRGPNLGDPVRLYNHSWVSQITGPQAIEVLRRVDYLVDTDGVLICAGVNNGRNTEVPTLLAGAYNIIAVGAMNGDSSGGYTTIEEPGRCKPDVVAPGGLTSFATPVTTSVVARLLEAARRGEREDTEEEGDARPQPVGAERPEVIKAVLMASAVKPSGWAAAEGHPLDQHFGAGVVHLDRALRVLEHGPNGVNRIRRLAGWDLGQITADHRASYPFAVYEELTGVSLMLVWHRRIDGRSVAIHIPEQDRVIAGWAHGPRLADLDLRLVAIDDVGGESELALSASRVDNVEHIYLPTLQPGRYRVEVTREPDHWRDEPWRYALAWWMQ